MVLYLMKVSMHSFRDSTLNIVLQLSGDLDVREMIAGVGVFYAMTGIENDQRYDCTIHWFVKRL